MSLERTKKTLSQTALNAAVRAIAYSTRVVLIGLGSSAQVAEDASNKLLRAGYNAVSYADTHMQAIAVSQLRPGDTLIGISQSGASKDIVESMKVAKSRGARTIAITSREKSPIARHSEIVLLTDTEETRHSILGLNSHLARQVVIDSLCYKLVYENAERAHTIDEGEEELKAKRIAD